jgi:hypothetical protein
MHDVNDVRQIEMHTAEPLVSQPLPFDVEVGVDKFRGHNSPCINFRHN